MKNVTDFIFIHISKLFVCNTSLRFFFPKLMYMAVYIYICEQLGWALILMAFTKTLPYHWLPILIYECGGWSWEEGTSVEELLYHIGLWVCALEHFLDWYFIKEGAAHCQYCPQDRWVWLCKRVSWTEARKDSCKHIFSRVSCSHFHLSSIPDFQDDGL